MRILNPEFPLQEFFQRLKNELSLLLLDYDGTLAPFQTDPAQAQPYSGVMDKIQQIISLGKTRVIIMSGRSIADLLPFIKLKPMPELWGVHGSERRAVNGQQTTLSITEKQLAGLKKCEDGLQRLEKKTSALAAHWRGLASEEQQTLEKKILAKWGKLAPEHDLEVHSFDGGLELRPIGINKGKAVETLLQEDPRSLAAYLGDDLTDEDAFIALERKGLKVLVRKELRQTAADLNLIPPNELIKFFDNWIEAKWNPI